MSLHTGVHFKRNRLRQNVSCFFILFFSWTKIASRKSGEINMQQGSSISLRVYWLLTVILYEIYHVKQNEMSLLYSILVFYFYYIFFHKKNKGGGIEVIIYIKQTKSTECSSPEPDGPRYRHFQNKDLPGSCKKGFRCRL